MSQTATSAYDPKKGIDVENTHYSTFSSACTAFSIPRQQSLRAFRKDNITEQTQINDFFKSQKEFYTSPGYTQKKEVWNKFKDGRVAPIQYKNALFRSKNALAKQLGVRANPFKTRLAFLESSGVTVEDFVIDACKEPLSRSEATIVVDIDMVIERINQNFDVTISDVTIKQWVEAKDNCFTMPLTNLAKLFNVQYETIKRQVYDIKFNKKTTALDIIYVISTLKPSGNCLEVNSNKYTSLFQLMLEAKYKLSNKNLSAILTKYMSTLR